MNTEILKLQLKEKIGDRTILAAAFYTFNFQPDFFENYILPILVPKLEFKNSRLYNAILWRKTTLPPVVVYFDDSIQKASDSTAPLQDYELCPVRVGKFYHPKVSLILVENDKNIPSLVVVIGSNNITRAGWCENLEVATILEINQHYCPDTILLSLKEYVEFNFDNYGYKGTCEQLILVFLNNLKGNNKPHAPVFYHSSNDTFENFLQEQIFSQDDIFEVEIISPFFQKNITDSTPISILKKYTHAPIRCLIPFKHSIEIQLDQVTYEAYQQKGVEWCTYNNAELKDRYNHSKVYHLKGKTYNYIIVGSVNFTTNAWSGMEQGGNMETAILFKEKGNFQPMLTPVHLHPDWLFLTKKEEVVAEVENTFFRASPPIEFTIDWQKKTLLCEPLESVKGKNIAFHLIDFTYQISQKKEYTLPKSTYESLARNPLISIREFSDKQVYDHYYYPHQIGIPQRPFLEKFSLRDVRKLWQLLGEDEIDEAFKTALERLVNKYEKVDGTIHEELVKEGVINKMAAHIDGLLQLANDLFKPETTAERLREYLIQDTITSIPYYKRVFILEDETLNKGFMWVLLHIIKLQFYENVNHEAWKNIKLELKPIINQLDQEIADCQKQTNLDKDHLDWALSQLKK